MRELLFKNLTALDKGRKILSLSEEFSKDGVSTSIQRKFIYFIREEPAVKQELATPEFYIFKHRDTKQKEEVAFIKVKAHLYAVNSDRVYLISFCHSLKIKLTTSVKPSKTNLS